MLDIKYIRKHKEEVLQALRAKNMDLDLDHLLHTDKELAGLTASLQELQRKKNINARGFKSARTPEQKTRVVEEGKKLALQIQEHQALQKSKKKEFDSLMLRVPNIPCKQAPVGKDSRSNKVIKTWGQALKKPKSHIEILSQNQWADFLRTAGVSGSRTYALKGDAVFLEQALLDWAAAFLVKKGFELISCPSFSNRKALVGSGHFPEGEADIYPVEKDQLYLSGTSEVFLNSLYQGEVLKHSRLPVLMAGLSSCFRREAGSFGQDVKGLLRVHQFRKLEQFVICENSEESTRKWHNFLLHTAEDILQAFEIPYRVVLVSTGDMGPGKYMMHDIECFLPSLNKYVETHSCSSLREWQARRTGLRYKSADQKVHYCHTLNNTAVAVPRLLAVFLENHQKSDGTVSLPKVLQAQMAKECLPSSQNGEKQTLS